jgi:hypothetical protein
MMLFAKYQFDFYLEFELDDALFEIYWTEWAFDIFAKYLFDSAQ